MTTEVDQLLSAGVPPWLADAVARLARRENRSLDSHLLTVGEPVTLQGTRATCRCHYIRRDGNDRPRIQQLADKLAEQAVDYCIPRSRIEEADRFFKTTGSAEQFAQLVREARSLFTTLKKSGEGGELLLYFLLEVGLGLPQLLCKMPLKTNAEMHVHGVDGIHGEIVDDKKLALYWGESKLYATVGGAINSCFNSIAPYLLDAGGGPATRDLLLLRDNLDTGNSALTEALLAFLLTESPLAADVEVRGACLVGFSLEGYPDPLGPDGSTLLKESQDLIKGWFDHIGRRVKAKKIQDFHLEVFCVPFPAVDTFRKTMLASLAP